MDASNADDMFINPARLDLRLEISRRRNVVYGGGSSSQRLGIAVPRWADVLRAFNAESPNCGHKTSVASASRRLITWPND